MREVGTAPGPSQAATSPMAGVEPDCVKTLQALAINCGMIFFGPGGDKWLNQAQSVIRAALTTVSAATEALQGDTDQ